MILHGRVVDQVIDRSERASFVKELVVTAGPVPLAMVRKRAVAYQGATRAPILLVHGFGQNRHAWHLPSRSVANHLAAAGYDVFNLDLRGHGRSRHLGERRSRGVEDYVLEDLPSAVDEVRRLSGERPVFIAGHSLGGLVIYAAAPALEGALAGIVSVGSPYHFTRGSRSLAAIGLVFGALAAARVPHANARFPVQRIGGLLRVLRGWADTPFYPVPLRGWHRGSLEPHVLDEHLRLAFDHAAMGEMANMFAWAKERRFGGRASAWCDAFEALDVPLLVVAGQNDDLAPAAGVKPAYVRSRSTDKEYRALPLGHIDLLVGRDAPLMTWPLMRDWIGRRAPPV